MRDLDDAFTRLLGHQPSDKERQNLYRVKDALKLKSTDAVWMLLMALEHYETLYEAVPEKIRDTVREVTKTVRETALAQARAAEQETRKALMEAVREAAVASSKAAAGTRFLQWVCATVALVAALLVAVGLWQFRKGEVAGIATGENLAKQQCEDTAAAASWANTPEGQVAYALAQVGSLRDLATCAGRGWVTKSGFCFARPENGWVRWKVPLDVARGRR